MRSSIMPQAHYRLRLARASSFAPRAKRLVFPPFAKGVDEADDRAQIVLALHGNVGIEKGGVKIVRAGAQRERPYDSVLHAAARGPGKLVGEAGNGAAAGRGVDSGFARSAEQKFGIESESAFTNRIEDGPAHVIQHVGMASGVEQDR